MLPRSECIHPGKRLPGGGKAKAAGTLTRAFFVSSILAALNLIVSESAPSLAQGVDRSTLPAGYYIYLGPQAGQLPPKAFTIDKTQGVIWQDGAASGDSQAPLPGYDKQDSQPTPSSLAAASSAFGDRDKQWETYDYPVIKWKPHPISTVQGGVAQLSTTLELGTGSSHFGYLNAGADTLKYKITLFKVSEVPASVNVQFLDANGFNLFQFQINGAAFHPVPGTKLLEASLQTACTDKAYRAAQDYSVSSTPKPNFGRSGVFRQF